MMDEEDIDDFLEHFGVKGMRWGYRSSKAKRGDFHYRSGGQKAAVIGGGIAGYMLGVRAARKIMNRVGRNVIIHPNEFATKKDVAKLIGFGVANTVVTAGASIVGIKYGARLTRNFLDRHGNVPVSELRKAKK